MKKLFLMLMAAGLFSFTTISCDSKQENAADDVEDATEEAADEVEDTAEDLDDSLEVDK